MNGTSRTKAGESSPMQRSLHRREIQAETEVYVSLGVSPTKQHRCSVSAERSRRKCNEALVGIWWEKRETVSMQCMGNKEMRQTAHHHFSRE